MRGKESRPPVEPSGGWQWVTGEPWDYTHWALHEPTNNDGVENVIQIYEDLRGWNDNSDSKPGPGYIVEYSVSDCRADLNGDGHVGSGDLAVLLGFWGLAAPTGDLNDDGIVNSADLSLLLGAWGPCA